MCVFLFGLKCHRNSEWAASNLELLIGLALPHVTEQVPAGLSDASCRSQHRLSGLYEDDITTFITLAGPALTQAPVNYLKQTSGSKILITGALIKREACNPRCMWLCGYWDHIGG